MRDIGEDDFDFPDTQGFGAEERKDGDSFMTFEEAEILTAQVVEINGTSVANSGFKTSVIIR